MNGQKKVTIYDLAEITGFSVGTVNRALNGKDRIKEETRRLILDAAERAGYRANPAAQGLRRNRMTIGVILYCQVDEYVREIHRGVCTAAQEIERYNVTSDVHLLPYTSNRECREATLALMRQFCERGYHGMVLFPSSAGDTLDEIRCRIDEMADAGIPVVTVATDVPNSKRLFHVGVNAHLAGQMAAELLSLTCSGQDVAILNHSMQSHTNCAYVEGFRAFAGEHTFRSIRMYAHYDEPDLVLRETERMIEENPAPVGIYMASASSVLACRHMRTLGRRGDRIITTDLLKETPGLLCDGTAFATIFQDPYRQGKTALLSLYEYLLSKRYERETLMTPTILLASNVGAYPIGGTV